MLKETQTQQFSTNTGLSASPTHYHSMLNFQHKVASEKVNKLDPANNNKATSDFFDLLWCCDGHVVNYRDINHMIELSTGRDNFSTPVQTDSARGVLLPRTVFTTPGHSLLTVDSVNCSINTTGCITVWSYYRSLLWKHVFTIHCQWLLCSLVWAHCIILRISRVVAGQHSLHTSPASSLWTPSSSITVFSRLLIFNLLFSDCKCVSFISKREVKYVL